MGKWLVGRLNISFPPKLQRRQVGRFPWRPQRCASVHRARRGRCFLPHAPEWVDAGNAPQRALARGADQFVSDDDIAGIGVQLREMPHRHPTAARDFDSEGHIVQLVVHRHFARGGDSAIDDQFDLMLPTCEGIRLLRLHLLLRIDVHHAWHLWIQRPPPHRATPSPLPTLPASHPPLAHPENPMPV